MEARTLSATVAGVAAGVLFSDLPRGETLYPALQVRQPWGGEDVTVLHPCARARAGGGRGRGRLTQRGHRQAGPCNVCTTKQLCLGLQVNIISMHTHPSYWREPDRFMPERFLPGTPEAAEVRFWLHLSVWPPNHVCRQGSTAL